MNTQECFKHYSLDDLSKLWHEADDYLKLPVRNHWRSEIARQLILMTSAEMNRRYDKEKGTC